MKLLKKLLPAATIASSIACVAPIITACGSGGIDITKQYTPTIAQHEATSYTTDAAVTEYFTKAKANTQIVIQDFYWSETRDIEIPETLKASGSIKLSGVSIDTDKKTFSCSVNQTMKSSGTVEGVAMEGDMTISLTLTDMPYEGYYNAYSTEKYWTFGAVTDKDKWLDSTKLVGSESGYEKVAGVEQKVNIGTKTITNKTEIISGSEEYMIYNLIYNACWESYYFAKVTQSN